MGSNQKVAIYARVSTEDQSVDAQLRDLREYAERRGWKDVQEFIDVGHSGSKDSRPAWNEVRDAIQYRKINVLLVAALDRVGRSLPHLVRIIGELQEQNVNLVSLRESIDLGTAQGRMLAGLFSVLAGYELELIRERTRAGIRSARAKGKQIGNRKRYFDKRKATELRDQGLGQIKIAKALGVGVGRVNEWVRNEYQSPSNRNQSTTDTRAIKD